MQMMEMCFVSIVDEIMMEMRMRMEIGKMFGESKEIIMFAV